MKCLVIALIPLYQPVRRPAVFAAITVAAKKKKPLSVFAALAAAW